MKKEEINSSRRKFIKISGSTLAASTVGFNVVANPYPSHLFNVDTLKVAGAVEPPCKP